MENTYDQQNGLASRRSSGDLFPGRLLGFGLLLAWVTVSGSFEQASDIAALSSSIGRLYISMLLSVVGYIAVACFVRATGHNLWTLQSAIVCGVCAIAYPAFDLLAVGTEIFAFDVCALIFKSAATVGLFFMWTSQIATHKLRTAWIAYAGSMVLAACLCMLIRVLGQTVTLVAVFLLGPASCALYFASMHLKKDEVEETPSESIVWHIPWRPLVLIVVFSFAQNIVAHYGGNAQDANNIGRLIAALIILIPLLVAFDRFDINIIIKICPVFIIAALLLCGIHGYDDSFSPNKLLSSMGFDAFLLYIYFMLSALSYRYKIRAEWLFGIVLAGNALMTPLGASVGDWLYDLEATSDYIAIDATVGAVVVVVVLATMLLLTGRALNDAWGIKGIRIVTNTDGTADNRLSATSSYLRDRAHQCALIARHYGLTHREEEVLSLLAEEKTFQEIETMLCIAHGTLRAHVQHIYLKLDVHSGEEARAFVASWRPE